MSRELLRLALENTGHGVVIYRPDDRVVIWASDSLYEVAGMRPADLIGRPFRPLPPADAVAADARFQEAASAHRELTRYRHQLARPDGTTARLEVTSRLVFDGSGAVRYVVSSVRDISAEVSASEALETARDRYQMLAENASDVVYLVGTEGVIKWISPSVSQVLGYDPDELIGSPAKPLVHPEDLVAAERERRAALTTGKPDANLRMRYRHRDGQYRWMAVRGHVARDRDGNVIGGVSSLRDIEGEVAAEQALAASQAQFQLISENAADIVLVGDLHDRISWASPSAGRLGLDSRELPERSLAELVHPDDRERLSQVWSQLPQGPTWLECRLPAGGQEYSWYRGQFRVTAGNGWVCGWQHIQAEVEQRALDRSRQAALVRSENLFRSAMDNAPIGMAVLDLQRRFLQVNPALVRMLGWDQQWLAEHNLADVTDLPGDQADRKLRERVLLGEEEGARQEMALLTARGDVIWVDHSVGLVRDDQGRAVSYVSQFVDITEVRRAREQLRYLADHDPLTALPNRRWLTERLGAILSHPPRGGTEVGVLFCDLDGLKEANDTYGHFAGDEMIVAVAQRLRAAIREGDFTARVGGDEFVVLLPWLRTAEDLQPVAEAIRAAVDRDLHTGAAVLRPTLSIGATVAGRDEDPNEAILRADRALYRAKGAGGNQVSVVLP